MTSPAAEMPEGVLMRKFTIPESQKQVWIYLPADYKERRLPCVLIGPAGSPLYHGMSLQDGDSAEHIPYVKAGFAVIAYEISGSVKEGADDLDRMDAMSEFIDSNGGVDDAVAALKYATSRIPAIDPEKIYAAGHSSAATTALALAQASEQVNGVAVYAPPVDLLRLLDPLLPVLEDFDEVGDFLQKFSAYQNAEKITCPVLVFYSSDDELMDSAMIASYVGKLQDSKTPVRLVKADTGGHYQSMIDAGIASGVDWFQRIEAGDDLEMEEVAHQTKNNFSFLGETIQVELDPAMELIVDKLSISEKFSVRWSDENGEAFELTLSRGPEGEMKGLENFAEKSLTEMGIGEADFTEAPLTRGVFRGLLAKPRVSQEGAAAGLYFLHTGHEYWQAEFKGKEAGLEQAREVLSTCRSVETGARKWETIFNVGWDSPPHRPGLPPVVGGKTGPTKTGSGDPIVSPSISKMRGPALEFFVDERTPRAKPGNPIVYDQVEFALPDEKDACRFRCDLIFSETEAGENREDFVIFFDIAFAESLIFDKRGRISTHRLGDGSKTIGEFPVGETVALVVEFDRREGRVSVSLNGETLLSESHNYRGSDVKSLRFSYGGDAASSQRVGMDNLVVDTYTAE